MTARRICLLLLAVSPLVRAADGPSAPAALPPAVARSVDYVSDVQPILAKSCYACHGPDKQKGGLRLDIKAAALKGGDSGAVIVPGKGADSLLARYVAGLDADKVMPPKGERLTAGQVAILRAWIDQGAKWPDTGNDGSAAVWWSLRPLVKPYFPRLTPADARWVRTPVDAFVIARLREKGLAPAPEADRRTLIRRLSFDLIGLPPTPEEVQAFVADAAPDAYEKLVDRLLASPAYGERWGRHWLDVVHYGDTHGYDKDKPRPHAWPYRDYVIRAFNDDKPYGRFVQEQVAGDVLFPDTADGVEALGFIAAGPWDFIGHAEVPETKIDGKVARHLDRDDMVSNTVGTFMSLTVHCAQCHNHKFDPITQEDYYGLQAVFAAVDRTDRRYDVDPAVARKRTDLEARLREKCGRLITAGLTDEDCKSLVRANRELSALPPPRLVYAGGIHNGSGAFRGTGPDGGRPRPIHVLPRGDVTRPGKAVEPGALSVLADLPGCFRLPPDHTEADRRAALARYLSDPKNALTWRSIVNRVWRYHFGRGIVESPNDFGRMGQLPTHPELLDWLAADFRDGGQSLKSPHRLLVTSAIYRQASSVGGDQAKIDAENAYYWRMNRRKLEAEAVRDAALAVAGRLDRKMGGPGFQDFVIEKPEHSPHYEYDKHDPDDPRSHRRSVYRFLVRSQQEPFMVAMDCADPSMRVDRRNESLSALQALALLNNDFMVTMAKHFAERLERSGGDLSAQVARGVAEALGRPPTADEKAALTEYARRHGLANLCRVLFNLNEFVFGD
jgi:mono/diheme cytochrome c family protein